MKLGQKFAFLHLYPGRISTKSRLFGCLEKKMNFILQFREKLAEVGVEIFKKMHLMTEFTPVAILH